MIKCGVKTQNYDSKCDDKCSNVLFFICVDFAIMCYIRRNLTEKTLNLIYFGWEIQMKHKKK